MVRSGIRRGYTQTIVELKDATENVLAAPNASVRVWCKTFKRAIGQSMPQPKEGRGRRDIDVPGIIGMDGKVHQAVVQSAERADLGTEALGLVQQWCLLLLYAMDSRTKKKPRSSCIFTGGSPARFKRDLSACPGRRQRLDCITRRHLEYLRRRF